MPIVSFWTPSTVIDATPKHASTFPMFFWASEVTLSALYDLSCASIFSSCSYDFLCSKHFLEVALCYWCCLLQDCTGRFEFFLCLVHFWAPSSVSVALSTCLSLRYQHCLHFSPDTTALLFQALLNSSLHQHLVAFFFLSCFQQRAPAASASSLPPAVDVTTFSFLELFSVACPRWTSSYNFHLPLVPLRKLNTVIVSSQFLHPAFPTFFCIW
jgi:hypothetical protein